MKDAQVRVDHNVAWVVGPEQIQGRPNVFEKQGGTWLLVHHQGSRPPTP